MNEELKVIISAEIAKLKQSVEDAKSNIQGFKDKVKAASKEVDSDIKAMGSGISTGLKAGAVAFAAAGAALLALGASSAEYRNEQAKLVTAFESGGKSAETAKNTYNDLFRVLGDSGTATEAAAHLAQLKVGQEELAEYTSICQGVYATFGASLPIEGLTEAVNHTVNLGEVQGTLADALEWAGISTDAFNEKLAACSTEAEREKLIRETLNGLYGEAAANYEVNNAAILAQNEAQSKMNDAMAALGEVTQPVLTMLTELGANVLSAITPYLQDFSEKYLPVIKEILGEIGTKLGEALDWMLQHKEVLAAVAIAIGVVTTAIGLYNAVAAIKAAMAAAEVTTVWGLVAAYTAHAVAVMAALAPYLLIVAAIAAVIAIIVLCVKHWDDIKEAAAKAWEKIKEVWEVVANWINEKVVQPIVNFFQGLWNKIKEIFGVVKDWFVEKFKAAWNGIKQVFSVFVDYFKMQWENVKLVFSVVKDVLTGNFKGAWEGIKQIFSNVSTFFKGVFDKIKAIFSNIGSAIGGAISGTVKKAINGVLSTAVKIINGFISAINIAISVINAIPGVSISKLKKLDVPQLAKGGVIDSATLAVVGERGKEAVMPLENNLEWLDKLASMLNDRMGGSNQPIILKVGEKVFGEVAASSINSITRQTGTIPLVLV